MALEGKKYVINGYDVYFPYKPYGPQFAFMGKVLATCESSRSKGNANALLESPTGSGKTLALLCATLAWQHHFKMNKLIEIKAAAQPAWQQTGGGFLPEDADADATCSGGDARELQTKGNKGHRENKKQEKKPGVPKIIYATRTHSQIAQVIRELKKSSYKPSMAILASRKQYCTNKVSAKKGNVDEECKKLLHDVNKGCPQFKNMHKVRDHESLESGRPNSIHDIEDLVDVARSVKGCAYFASKTLAIGADIVFCPYNYILDPVIRRSMEIDLKGSILIFDEAHNIEDCAREAVTFNIELGSLEDLGGELDRLTTSEGLEPYGPLLQIIQGLSSWLREKSAQLRLQTSEASPQIWEGHQAARELENAGFSSRDLTDLLKFCKKVLRKALLYLRNGSIFHMSQRRSRIISRSERAIHVVFHRCRPFEDANRGVMQIVKHLAHVLAQAVDSSTTVGTGLDSMTLSGRGASILEGLFTVLNFMFGNDTQRLNDYRLVVQKHMNRDEAKGTDICVTSLGFWCLNPAVAFDSIIHISRAIILTSGTLAPMETFASELGLRFEASMEGSHVIDVEKQIWAASLSVGPGGVPFNASFKNADNPTFQDTLGAALEAFCRAIPDGVLVFFPSYKLLEKLSMRWKTTGRWKSLGSVKKIFIEPKGNDDQFQQTLKGYYRAIAGNLGQSKAGKGTLARKAAAPKNTGSTVKPGAVFFAVCRGKVSEGIDFADANARGVVSFL